MSEDVVIVETPRDAFQGLLQVVPTPEKIRYIRSLIDAGFRNVDLASFEPDIGPQLADGPEVVRAFQSLPQVERIALVLNAQGMERAFTLGGLDCLGFPFSLSGQFQMRRTKTTTTQTWPLVERLIGRVEQHDMSFIVYIAMAFGNPYGEHWDEEELFRVIRGLSSLGVRHVSLADTAAVAEPAAVRRVFQRAAAEHPRVKFSAHFHGRPDNWFDNIDAALHAGCRRFDAAIGGLGGCVWGLEKDVANVPSDQLAVRLSDLGYQTGVDPNKVKACIALARELHNRYANGVTPASSAPRYAPGHTAPGTPTRC
jgi:hydroxymethylglutaryl-CoA lyase